MMRRIQTVHFVGIGGVGMCGIAEVLINKGYHVQGSDIVENYNVGHLRQLGADVFIGHLAEHVSAADVIVVSSAINEDNPEIKAAREQRIPIVARAEMLAELMRFSKGIAVAGTHGKTTTTSLVASLLSQAGLDPTYVVGGKLTGTGSNANFGSGEYFVSEADESDASFLYLKPLMAVVTNIDSDHMSTYAGDFAKLEQTFQEFLHHLPFYGLSVMCADCPVAARAAARVGRPVMTYGIDNPADVRASNIVQHGLQSHFTLDRPGHPSLEITLNLPGKHNVQNALAAITIATECGVSDEAIQQAMASFAGIGRRFQSLGQLCLGESRVWLVDDYAHHPREIEATIQAMHQAWPDERCIIVFQPHRYSRTAELFDDFTKALSLADAVLLLDIYPAGESPLPGITSQALVQALHVKGQSAAVYVDSPESLPVLMSHHCQTNDVVMTLGAGSIGAMAQSLYKQYGVNDVE